MKQENHINNVNKEKDSNLQTPNISNPINQTGLIAKINSLNTRATSNRLYGGYNQYVEKPSLTINYAELLKYMNEVMLNKHNINELFYSFHNLVTNKLNCSFTSLGIINPQSNCMNIKLIDKIGSIYSSRVFLSDTNNEIVKSITENKISTHNDNEFLKIPYLANSPAIVLPITSFGENIGVSIIGDYEIDSHIDIYRLISNYYGLFIANFDLKEKATQSANIDTLTGLYSHRKFQELLAKELSDTKETEKSVSIVIFDVNNISQINREFGHAKGDEIIKMVATKISQNIKKQDFAGRYGGDEIAVVLPDMNTEEAKYLAEYLTYTLSCCLIDNVGPIKVSVGVATFPEASIDQEKLLILAEQAMYISKSKGYKNGISTIVSSQDYDFWEDMALNSFASVLAKRHSQIGINFEEELVTKFQNEEIISQNHLIDVVTSLASAIDAKDEYTKGHSTSVSRYAVALARAINLPEKEVERIKLGALLHDVGKIGIPENVLKKPTKLSDEEWEIMKQHPTIGAEKVLQPNPSLHDLIPIVKYHHEHWDGSGYPNRLKETEIPLAARIVAVADAYHALISDRPYRKGLGNDKACEILTVGAGVQWDEELVRQFVAIAPSLATMI
ncbi:MAG: diguanylate cyclase [Candidatus Gastranaerophilales bacterium]|nr:diguanylate cyclase [Candidatus Gastranaerophilales bacterium]